MNILFKVFAIIMHMIQAFISDNLELYFSFAIAVISLGAYVFDTKSFKRLFLVPQWGVSLVASIVWLIIAVIETPINQRNRRTRRTRANVRQ